MRLRLGEVLIDVSPLRESRGYRLVFAAQSLTVLGSALTNVAVNLQVFRLTRSSVQVGLVSLVFGLALLAGLLAGGVLADRADRRRIVLGTRAAVAVTLAGLAVNALLSAPQLWFVYLAAISAGGFNGLGGSALMAAIPGLAGRQKVVAAGALLTVTSQFGAMVGPAIAGLIAAGPGIAACFALDGLGYVIGIALMWPLPALLPEVEAGGEQQHPLRALLEGLRFVRRDQVVGGVLLIDLCAVFFAMPYALFPELGTEVFKGGPSTVGLLYTAPAIGAFLGALTSGWTGRVHPVGGVLTGAVALWGTAICLFGLSGKLWLALLFLALAGLGDTISEILRRGLIQHHTPDRLQGRVGSVWLAQATSGMAAGNAEAGLSARLLGAQGAVVAGGIVCVIGAGAVALALPGFRRAGLVPGAESEVESEVESESAGAGGRAGTPTGTTDATSAAAEGARP